MYDKVVEADDDFGVNTGRIPGVALVVVGVSGSSSSSSPIGGGDTGGVNCVLVSDCGAGAVADTSEAARL